MPDINDPLENQGYVMGLDEFAAAIASTLPPETPVPPEPPEPPETFSCDCCGDDGLEDDAILFVSIRVEHVRWTTICKTCADRWTFECSDCDEMFHSLYANCIGSGDGYQVCNDCYCGYNTCDDCGYVSRDLSYSDRHGTFYCDSCYPETSDLIHSYDYKPRGDFFGRGPLFFGVELELNVRDADTAAQRVLDNLGDARVYLKEDGSLSTGFEIVTHPHSFTEQVRLWSGFKPPRGASSHESGECGMHIHVSRAALTPLQVQKIVVFINSPQNTGFIERIAMRTWNDYCKIKHEKRVGHVGYPSDRYEAVNLTNRHTIEFRIFRGSLRVDRILKNLEFAHAVIHWVNDVSYQQLHHSLFLAYVAKHRRLYPHLYQFVGDKWEAWPLRPAKIKETKFTCA